MSGAILPFRRIARRQTEAAPIDQSATLRETRRLVAECWRLRAECKRIRRDYEARRKGVEKLLDGIG